MLSRLFLNSSRFLRVPSVKLPLPVKNVIPANPTVHNFSTGILGNIAPYRPILCSNPVIKALAVNVTPIRTLIKFSYRKGKRKTVKTVLHRFYRLNWGGWIRTKCGRHKRLWRKSAARKRRLRQHVFCNATQSTLLDKMVGRYWRKPKYYVDDPYEPYHVREEFSKTAVKPRPYFPPENII